MDKNYIYRLLENPSLLSDESLAELEKLNTEYPISSLISALYLKNLSIKSSSKFKTELKRLSIHIPDRRQLFLLIEDKLESQISHEEENNQADSFSLIDSFLQSNTTLPNDSFILHTSASVDYLLWSDSKEEKKRNADESAPVEFKHQKLIDTFLSDDKRKRPNQELVESEHVALEDDGDQTQLQEDTFFTETLSRIYIKQKRYERALQIIRKLSLKYPEKNAYFADQIRFLEKLIINNKK